MFGLNSVRKKFVALAMAVAGIFSAGTVCAQSLIQPPAIATVDANGVDLTSGKFTLPGLNVSIGTSDSGLARIAGLNGSDNNTGILKITGVPVGTNGSSAYLQASLGGATSRFFIWYSGPGVATDVTNHSPYYSNGARLDCDNVGAPLPISSGLCHLTAADGTYATYEGFSADSCKKSR